MNNDSKKILWISILTLIISAVTLVVVLQSVVSVDITDTNAATNLITDGNPFPGAQPR